MKKFTKNNGKNRWKRKSESEEQDKNGHQWWESKRRRRDWTASGTVELESADCSVCIESSTSVIISNICSDQDLHQQLSGIESKTGHNVNWSDHVSGFFLQYKSQSVDCLQQRKKHWPSVWLCVPSISVGTSTSTWTTERQQVLY